MKLLQGYFSIPNLESISLYIRQESYCTFPEVIPEVLQIIKSDLIGYPRNKIPVLSNELPSLLKPLFPDKHMRCHLSECFQLPIQLKLTQFDLIVFMVEVTQEALRKYASVVSEAGRELTPPKIVLVFIRV